MRVFSCSARRLTTDLTRCSTLLCKNFARSLLVRNPLLGDPLAEPTQETQALRGQTVGREGGVKGSQPVLFRGPEIHLKGRDDDPWDVRLL